MYTELVEKVVVPFLSFATTFDERWNVKKPQKCAKCSITLEKYVPRYCISDSLWHIGGAKHHATPTCWEPKETVPIDQVDPVDEHSSELRPVCDKVKLLQ